MTLDYTTAKALRDCGYPQAGCEKAYYLNGGENTNAVIDAEMYANVSQSFWEEKLVAIPNLSEIIQELEPNVQKFIFESQEHGIKTLVANGLGYGPFTSFERCAAEAYLSIHKK